jgi:serine protease Do
MQQVNEAQDAQPSAIGQVSGAPINSRKGSRSAWIALAVILAALIVSIAIVQASYYKLKGREGELPMPGANPAAAVPSPGELSKSFREVAKVVKPAVVNINIVELVQQGNLFPQIPGFGFPEEGVPKKVSGAGSGVIVTPDGYILTNNHVVSIAKQIEVTLADGRKFKASRIGTDPETDLAVIKIDAAGLPIAVLGDSDKVEQGDWVLALGSPFGLQQTLTAGIVSATGRDIPGSQFSRFIQTDASINPGNSGGPLVNMRGEVIGINTLIYSQTGGNIGIGFAIPSNLAREIYGKLVTSGKVTRGYLGVFVKELGAAEAHMFGVEPQSGVLVQQVTDPDSPAAKAGLMSGDIITAVDGKLVKTPQELTSIVADMPVGKTVRVDFIRDGKPQSVNVTLAERPTTMQARAVAPDEDGGGEDYARSSRLGVSVQTVTPELAKRMRLQIPSGALVQTVEPASPAADAGIKHGDVIHRVDRTLVKTAKDLVQAVKSLNSGQEFALQVERNGRIFFVTVTFD